jgi:hypothetical protein
MYFPGKIGHFLENGGIWMINHHIFKVFWHLLGHAIMSVICFDLQFSRSTRPMTSFCIVIAYINTRGNTFRIIFNGALCEVRAYYNVTISYRQSTRIRYQKNYLGKLPFITKIYWLFFLIMVEISVQSSDMFNEELFLF